MVYRGQPLTLMWDNNITIWIEIKKKQKKNLYSQQLLSETSTSLEFEWGEPLIFESSWLRLGVSQWAHLHLNKFLIQRITQAMSSLAVLAGASGLWQAGGGTVLVQPHAFSTTCLFLPVSFHRSKSK